MPSKRAAKNRPQDSGLLQAELDRAAREIRGALGAMAMGCRLHPALMAVSTLMDRVQLSLDPEPGNSSFSYDEVSQTISFRADVLRKVLESAELIPNEMGITDAEEAVRIGQVAVNLFIAHELMHVCQNFPHFSAVGAIKTGVPAIGLPLLDLVADVVAARVCAVVESRKTALIGDKEVQSYFSNMLIISYCISAFVFDATTNPVKRQRSLGLLVSALLVQSVVDERIVATAIYEAWEPNSPLFLFNVEDSGSFNALVIDAMLGLLFPSQNKVSKEKLQELWDSVGTSPITRTITLVAELLAQVGAIR